MNEYRLLTSLPDHSIIFIACEIFKPVKCYVVSRDDENQSVVVSITTEWEGDKDEGTVQITDHITFNEPFSPEPIEVWDFAVHYDDILKYRQYMLAQKVMDREYITDNKYFLNKD